MGVKKDDIFYMQRAVTLAQQAAGRTSPNPLVGCVIVKNGKVIAEGSPSNLRQQHAPGYVAAFDRRHALTQLKNKATTLGYSVSEDSSGVYVRAPQLELLLRFQQENNLHAIQLRPSHLEDVFLKLTGQELTADA